jgi:hypothetical protein
VATSPRHADWLPWPLERGHSCDAAGRPRDRRNALRKRTQRSHWRVSGRATAGPDAVSVTTDGPLPETSGGLVDDRRRVARARGVHRCTSGSTSRRSSGRPRTAEACSRNRREGWTRMLRALVPRVLAGLVQRGEDFDAAEDARRRRGQATYAEPPPRATEQATTPSSCSSAPTTPTSQPPPSGR